MENEVAIDNSNRLGLLNFSMQHALLTTNYIPLQNNLFSNDFEIELLPLEILIQTGNYFEHFSDSLLTFIFQHFSNYELCSVAQVCKNWFKIAIDIAKKRRLTITINLNYAGREQRVPLNSYRNSDEEILAQIEPFFPEIQNLQQPIFIVGVNEERPDGVFCPLTRIEWLTSNVTHFLIVLTGNAAVEAYQEKQRRQYIQTLNRKYMEEVKRMRWQEGWRKCIYCKKMFKIQENHSKACKNFEEPKYYFKCCKFDFLQNLEYVSYDFHTIELQPRSSQYTDGWTLSDFLELPGLKPNLPRFATQSIS
eukprot:TRINITY_DN4017_c0_g1_i1.p1 TRINITY_DN4017_c0_g1~~TRINITY_DN4017_c0_g1_i1.p1  ORF type:complete len:318 (+),score=120.93 TRINITY_DN4017_c0_g1_i1:35-955(+)